MSPDKTDLILQKLEDHVQQQSKFETRVEPLLTLVIQHETWIDIHKKEKMPGCDRKFNKLFNIMWWVLGTLLIASLGFISNVVAKAIADKISKG